MLAFSHCGMFTDPESAYTMSMAYYEEQQKKLAEQTPDPDNDPNN